MPGVINDPMAMAAQTERMGPSRWGSAKTADKVPGAGAIPAKPSRSPRIRPDTEEVTKLFNCGLHLAISLCDDFDPT